MMKKGFCGLVITLIVIGFAAGCSRVSRVFGSGSGTEFTVRVETEKTNLDDVVGLAVKVIGGRLDAAGLDGEAARIPNSPDQIRVKVYGNQDPERVKRFLFTTHELELKKVVSAPNPSPVTTYPNSEAAASAAGEGKQVLPLKLREGRPPSQFIIVEAEPIVTGEDIRTANAADRTGAGGYSISFTLRKDGAQKLGDWTGRNINNYMAVVLDGSVVSTAFIKSQILDSGEISGTFTKASAEELAANLNSGYLPATLTVVDEHHFGN